MKTKVSIVKCCSYEQEEIETAIRQAVNLIGGLDKIVQRKQRVLIKPNLLAAHPPDKQVTTHPAVIKAIIKLLQELGATVFIGDSPGGFGTLKGIENLWEETGLKKISEETGVKLLNFEQSGSEEIIIQGVKKSFKVSITKALKDNNIEFIINVPKFKTHDVTILTGAVKNMFGIMPGLTKANMHKIAPRPKELAEFLVALCGKFPPALNIMDGVWGIEGEGPGTSGTPRFCGVIMASFDAVAMDVVMSQLVGLKPEKLPTTQLAKILKIGQTNLENIIVVGETLKVAQIKNFKFPSTSRMAFVPSPVVRFLGKYVKFIKPKIVQELCTKCQMCLRSCPVQTIYIDENKNIQIYYKHCIECLCCVEVCPDKAIEIQKSLVLKLLE